MASTTKQRMKSVDELRKWLQPTDYHSPGNEYMKHLNSYVSGTGDWLRESEAFRKWEDGTETGCLWVRGLPGSGKSVFAASTVKTLAETQDSEGRKSPVLFFFFRQIVEKNHDPKYLIRDWVAQLLPFSSDLQEGIDGVSREFGAVNGCEASKLWDALAGAMKQLTKVYCVADALDEMDDQHASFIDKLKELGGQRPDRIKVMLTSRPIPRIENLLRHPTVEPVKLEPAQIYPDIVSYVSTRLEGVRLRLGREKEVQVSKSICDRSGGLFLYARLMMDSLIQGLEEGSIIEETLPTSLAQLPQNLTELYTRLLEEHSKRSNVTLEQQFTILQCVILSSRPMRLIELGSLMAFLMKNAGAGLKEGKETVKQACGRLLEILEDESVSVIHHSFTEFVKAQSRSTDSSAFPVLNEKQAHGLMLQVCLQYLDSCQLSTSVKPSAEVRAPLAEPPSNVAIDHWGDDSEDNNSEDNNSEYNDSEDNDFDDDDFDTGSDCSRVDEKKQQEIQHLRSTYPFMAYATKNLAYHIKATEAAGNDLLLLDSYFVPEKNAFEVWLLVEWHQSRQRNVQPLHVAAYLGLTAYSRHLITTASNIDIQDGEERTALMYAAERGHVEIASLLLAHGANPDADDRIGYKPLHFAAMENQPEIARLLLAAGVSPKTPKTMCTPELEMSNDAGDTPLLYACRSGNIEILNQFIGYLNTDDACRSLQWAVSSGKPAAVEAILKTGKVPVDVLVDGVSALIHAAEFLNPAVLEVLLKHGANPNLRAEKDKWWGVGSVDAEITLKGDSENGPTAMHLLAGFQGKASLFGRRNKASECMQLLIDAGSDINAKTIGNHTPLHYAVKKRFTTCGDEWGPQKSEEIMTDLLLQHGADPNARCISGSTPLHKLNPHCPNVVGILARNGADVNARDNVLCTPLLRILESSAINAWDNNNSKNVELSEKTLLKLLEHGADVSTESEQGWTAFHLMFKKMDKFQNPELWKAFIKAGADLNKPNKNGKPPLLLLRGGRGEPKNEALLKFLVGEGLQLNSTQLSDNQLLFKLFDKHDLHVGSFQELFNLGCSVKATDLRGATLLHRWAKTHTSIDLFEFLVNCGADPLAVDNDKNTLFHELALAHPSRGIYSKTQALIKLGVSPDAKNKAGRTALHIACATSPENTGFYNERAKGFLDLLLGDKLFPKLNPDALDSLGASPMHYAASISEFHVGRLLGVGADPTLKTKEGVMPLHIAARGRQSNVIGLILSEYMKRGILQRDIDATDDNGRTALHYACRSGRRESVSYLLSAGASFTIRDKAGRTPLHALAEYETESLLWTRGAGDLPNGFDAACVTLGDPARPGAHTGISNTPGTERAKDILEILETYGADLMATFMVDGTEYSLVDLAVQMQCAELVNELRNRGLSTQDKLVEDMDLIPKAGGMREAKALLERVESPRHRGLQGPNDGRPSKKDHPKKFEAILQKKDYNLFIEFVNAGGDLSARAGCGQSPGLHLLVTWGHGALLEMYSEEAARMDGEEWMKENENPGSLLCHACELSFPRLDIIKVLVEKVKVDVNHISNRYGYMYKGSKATALHWLSVGAHFWQIQAIKYLVDHGADIEARNAHGETPLMTAVGSSSPNGFWKEQTIRVLLERGADPNVLSNNGESCLTMADHSNVTRMLLDHGADIMVGRPPLTWALQAMDVDAAKMLLENGADPNQYWSLHQAARPCKGDSDDIFLVQRQRDIISLLLKCKANPFAFFEDGFSILQMTIEEHGILDLFWNLPNFPIELRGKGGRTPLISACFPSFTPRTTEWSYNGEKPKPKRTCDPDAAAQLLEMQADVSATDEIGRTALHWLCTLPEELDETYKALFTTIVDSAPSLIQRKDNKGLTPLQIATANSHTHNWITNFLITSGCDPADPDPIGNTILHYLAPQLLGEKTKALAAAERFKEFLSRGLSINHRNNQGETPLFCFISTSWEATSGGVGTTFPTWAIENDISHIKALHLFLDAGVDLQTTNHKEETLLHITASRWREKQSWGLQEDQRRDMLEIFKDLMARGVDPRAEDLEYRTAIDIAVACKNTFLVDLFGSKEREMVKNVVVEDTEDDDDNEDGDKNEDEDEDEPY